MRAAVLGSPISHSLSPVIHNAGYAAAGLTDWEYTAIDCDKDDLAATVAELDNTWAGLSLTMPLKEIAFEVADEISETAAALGAINTFHHHKGRWIADNTDSIGLVDALSEHGLTSADAVAILGAGGTARAALGAASVLGARTVHLYARRAGAIADLQPVAHKLGLSLHGHPWDEANQLQEYPLVVSTVPKGITDTLHPQWNRESVLFDVVYNPWPTPLAAHAQSSGVDVVDGLALLLHQALHQWRRFTGENSAPVEAMRAALYTAAKSSA